jgi:hypothetical protein
LQVGISKKLRGIIAKIDHRIQPCMYKGNMKPFQVIFNAPAPYILSIVAAGT